MLKKKVMPWHDLCSGAFAQHSALCSAVSGGQCAEATSGEEGARKDGAPQGPGRKQQLQQEDRGEAKSKDGGHQREPQRASQRSQTASAREGKVLSENTQGYRFIL